MASRRLNDNGRRAPAALAPFGIKRMIGKEKSRLGAASDGDAALKEKSRQSQGQIHLRARPCDRALGILRLQIAIPRNRNGPEEKP
jgi:hypothetical protein